MVNSSLSTGVFPSAYKQSYITLLIKYDSLDGDALNSYRPVSILPFLSKVIETAVCNQLMAHFDSHGVFDSHQSAYRPGHGVETAMQHVYSSIFEQLDRGQTVFLVLLDLSAAFDTISVGYGKVWLSETFFNKKSQLSQLTPMCPRKRKITSKC